MVFLGPKPELLVPVTVLWRRKHHAADPIPEPTLRSVDAARGEAQADEKEAHIDGQWHQKMTALADMKPK